MSQTQIYTHLNNLYSIPRNFSVYILMRCHLLYGMFIYLNTHCVVNFHSFIIVLFYIFFVE